MRKFWGFYDNGTYRVGCSGATIYLYDQSDRELCKFRDIPYAYTGAFQPHTNRFAAKSTDGSLAFYDLDGRALLKKITITHIGAQDEGFAFSPDGRLFLLYSANNVTSGKYCLGLLEFTGDDILARSSWTKTDHAVFEGTAQVSSPGHCSVFMSPDGTEYWLAYHFQMSGRKLAVQQFTFDENGDPVFGEPVKPLKSFFAPAGEE